MTFQADFAGAIVVEAATYGYSQKNRPKAIGLHTPEEKPDDYPGTPYYFHNLTDRQASTTYFAAWTGLIFQMVPEDEGAYGNAIEGKPPPPWSDGTNLNLQTISIEIEGYAASIHQTMPRGSPQWVSLVRLMADICHRRPAVNIDWTFGHYLVSIYRSDPGQLDIGALVADVKALLSAAPQAKEWDEMATEQQVLNAARQGAAEAVAALTPKLNEVREWSMWENNIGGREDRFIRASSTGAIYETVSRPLGISSLVTTRHWIPNFFTGLLRGFNPDGSNILNLGDEYPFMTEDWLDARYPKGDAVKNMG